MLRPDDIFKIVHVGLRGLDGATPKEVAAAGRGVTIVRIGEFDPEQ